MAEGLDHPLVAAEDPDAFLDRVFLLDSSSQPHIETVAVSEADQLPGPWKGCRLLPASVREVLLEEAQQQEVTDVDV